MIDQNQILWDEKNLTELQSSCKNKNEQETSDITKNIKTSSTPNDWRNITDPKVRRKMRQKVYRETNKEKIRETQKIAYKKHYEANKEKIQAAHGDYNKLNKDKIKKQRQEYYQKNKRKILDKDFNIDELVDEDRQAILIFLRNTAFGSEYEMEMIDSKTNLPFKFTLDLSILKVKDFNLKPDENGEYSYFMKSSKKNVTFKYLNNVQEKDLIKIRDNSPTAVAPVTTKRLEMMIKSVDGMRDQMGIYQFIQNLPIKDSQEFRKFSNENKPGIDLSVDVKTPSGDTVKAYIDFGVEFFRPFYGI